MNNISRFLPSNVQLLAQRQHEELEQLRQLVPVLEQRAAGLEAALAEAEKAHSLLEHERDHAVHEWAALALRRLPMMALAALAGGFLAIFVIRAWGW